MHKYKQKQQLSLFLAKNIGGYENNPKQESPWRSGNWFSGSLGYGSGNLTVEKGDKGANEKEASLPGQFTLGSHINQMFMVDAISRLTNNLINHKSTNWNKWWPCHWYQKLTKMLEKGSNYLERRVSNIYFIMLQFHGTQDKLVISILQ